MKPYYEALLQSQQTNLHHLPLEPRFSLSLSLLSLTLIILFPREKRRVYAFYFYFAFYLSLNSCENIFCQISIHLCCCAVRGFPGLLNDRVRMSRNLERNIFITSIVFQSDTANRALFPSRMKTPANICSNISMDARSRNNPTHITANISAE
jgi:hypothetical protein